MKDTIKVSGGIKLRKRLLSLGVVLALLVTLVAACSGPEEKKQKFFAKGKSLYEKGEFVKAGLEFRNAIQIDPKFADAYYMLGMVELKKKDPNPKRAYGAFSKAVELNPNLQDAHIQLGNILLMARQPDKALEKAETVLKLSPGNEDALLLKAAALLSLKNSTEAFALLQQMQQRGMKRPELFLLLASTHLQNNRLQEAQGVLNTGIAANPQSIILYLTLADLYSRDKKIDEAAATMQKVIALEPKNSRYRLNLASLYWYAGQQDKATALLSELVASEPGNEEYRLQVGGFYLSKGRFADTERELKAGISSIPKSFKLRFALSDLYFNAGMTDRSMVLLKECLALEKDPGNRQILQTKNALARVYLARQEVKDATRYVDEVIKENAKDVDAHFTKGNIALSNKNGTEAVAEFRAVTSESPQFLLGYIRLADAHILNREYSLASDTLQKALKIRPDSREVIQAMVRLDMVQKDYAKAEEKIRQVLKQNPDDPEAGVALGDLYLVQKDYSRAAAAYGDVVKKVPKHPAGYVRLSGLYMAQGQLDRAAGELEKALKLDPRSAQLSVSLVQIYMKQKKYNAALAVLENRLRLNPMDALALSMSGQIYTAQGNERKAEEAYRQAMVVYEKILERQPDQWIAANDLAFLLSQYGTQPGDLKRAFSLAGKAYEKHPDNPAVLDTLGWIYYKMGDYRHAQEMITKGLVKAPSSAMLNYHLGMVLLKTGQTDKGKERLNWAVRSGEEFSGRQEALQILGMR